MKNAKQISLITKKRGTSQEKNQKEQVYERLKNWIIFTELQPGTLLNEREFAIKFGISRTPLREILQRLSYKGDKGTLFLC